jgi:hypothetical protein
MANRIGIWLDNPTGAAPPPELSVLAHITARTVNREGRDLLEVSTHTTSIQRQFYHFALAVAERLTVEHRPATEAVAMELQCFADLLAEKPLLGIERQIALLGELLFLERLIEAGGPAMVSSWVGPSGEPHDFRTDLREFEVKTTVSTRRVHTIHGTDQMLASPGCSLFLVSVLLGPAGAATGCSLASKVSELTQTLGTSPVHSTKFANAVESCGYRESDNAHYSRAFILRRPQAVVPIDRAFPAITRTPVYKVLGPLASRLESIQYDVDVEGLEHEDQRARGLNPESNDLPRLEGGQRAH